MSDAAATESDREPDGYFSTVYMRLLCLGAGSWWVVSIYLAARDWDTMKFGDGVRCGIMFSLSVAFTALVLFTPLTHKRTK